MESGLTNIVGSDGQPQINLDAIADGIAQVWMLLEDRVYENNDITEPFLSDSMKHIVAKVENKEQIIDRLMDPEVWNTERISELAENEYVQGLQNTVLGILRKTEGSDPDNIRNAVFNTMWNSMDRSLAIAQDGFEDDDQAVNFIGAYVMFAISMTLFGKAAIDGTTLGGHL